MLKVSHFEFQLPAETNDEKNQLSVMINFFPTLEYGITNYSSGLKSAIRKIHSLQNTAIRISLGAYRSSPIDTIDSLCFLANEMPPKDRRSYLTLSYASRVDINQENTMYNEIFKSGVHQKNVRNAY